MAQAMSKKIQPNVRNGVNVAGVFEVIDAVKADPELAQFKFRASNSWIDGGHNQSTIKSFYGCKAEDSSRHAPFVLDADEPPVLLGRDAEPVAQHHPQRMLLDEVAEEAAQAIADHTVQCAANGNINPARRVYPGRHSAQQLQRLPGVG